MPSLKIRYKLMIALAVAILPLTVLGAYRISTSYQERKSVILSSQLYTARAASAAVEAFTQDVFHQHETVGDILIMGVQGPDQISRHLAVLRQNTHTSRAAIYVTASGEVVASDPPSNPALRLREASYFQRLLNGEGRVVGDIERYQPGDPNSAVYWSVATAIRDDKGWMQGAIISQFGPDTFAEQIIPYSFGEGGGIAIFDRTGRILYTDRAGSLTWEQRDASGLPFMKEALAGETVLLDRFRDFFGDYRIAARVAIPSSGWVVGVSSLWDVAMAPVNSSTGFAISVFAAALLLTVFVAWYVSERICRPLEELRQGMIGMAQGDFFKAVRIRTGDEIEDLADVFYEMRRQLQKRDAANLTLIESLREQESRRREMFSIISHDVRTPLTIIRGWTGFMDLQREMAAKGRPEGGIEDVPAAINEQVDQIVRLLETTLDATVAESALPELKTERFDLAGLAEKVAKASAVVTDKHSIRLDSPPAIPVEGDRGRIEQVLVNLVGNTIKYSPHGGDVWIAIRENGGEVEVAVGDEGIGIPGPDLEHVFDQFYRVDRPGQPEGMGLGLYICKLIVGLHSGRIWAESEDGKGSTFFFTIPLRQ